ncbi:MAG: hypothetical protein ACOCXJ_00040 [Planctomycetota bacterium]
MLRICCLISCCSLIAAAAELTITEPGIDGVRIVHRTYEEAELRPLNWSVGYAVAVSGVLSRSVNSIAEGRVTVARTDTDQDLIPDGHWGSRISFPSVGTDGRRLMATVELQLPEASASRLAELRCIFTIQESAGPQPLRVSDLPMQAGGSITADGLAIDVVSIEESQWQEGTFEVGIKLPVASEALDGVRLVAADGTETALEQAGHMQVNDETTFTIRFPEQPPEQATLIVDLHRDMQTSEVELHLTDVPLLGSRQ